MTAGETWVPLHIVGVNYRPTMELRTRNVFEGLGMVGVIEQKWIADDARTWEWRRVPLVPSNAPMSGVGP